MISTNMFEKRLLLKMPYYQLTIRGHKILAQLIVCIITRVVITQYILRYPSYQSQISATISLYPTAERSQLVEAIAALDYLVTGLRTHGFCSDVALHQSVHTVAIRVIGIESRIDCWVDKIRTVDCRA